MDLDEVPDQPTWQRRDEFVTDCPDLHVIVVMQRPPKASIPKTYVQRQRGGHTGDQA